MEHSLVIISLTLCFLSSLYPSYASYRRMRERFCEATMSLFVFMSAYSLILLDGVFIRSGNSSSTDSLAKQQITAMVAQAGYNMDDVLLLMSAIAFGLVILNIAFGLIIQKTKHPIAYCLALITGVLVVVSVPAAVVTDSNPLANFFMECCGVMAYFAWLLDLTYKEFCVIGNIYVQAGLCLMSALAPLSICLRTKLSIGKTAFCAINAIIHSVVFYVVCVHYWMPLEDGFNLCYKELNQLAAYTGTTYIMVNIVIFVIMFVGDLLANAVIYQLVKRRNGSEIGD